MVYSLTYTKSNLKKHSIRKRTISEKLRMNSIAFISIAITLICALSLFYLSGIDSLAVKGYDINSREETLRKLKEENQNLKIEAAKLKAMRRISDSVEDLKMVRTKNISYISGADSSVATSR